MGSLRGPLPHPTPGKLDLHLQGKNEQEKKPSQQMRIEETHIPIPWYWSDEEK